tara:strand:- start:1108 stop:2613 length:1506 start_codon:yes stop_codon:yes gene_type:complete
VKVLSLFDGMSCGQIALNKLGVSVDTYYASEIDKYAIEITQKNYPETVQVGDITKLKAEDFKDVDLILAGSPCQGFSFAGKQLAFDDPRSALFFEFIRLLKEIKPKYFLLENVRMKKEFIDVISEQVSKCYPEILFGIEPILINSSLLSAQSRQRLYWTNIEGITQPKDKGIVLKDILEKEPQKFTKMSDKFVKRNGERNCMIDQTKEKASNLSAMEYVKNGRQGDYLACDNKGRPQQVGKLIEKVKVRKHKVDIPNLQHLLRVFKTYSGKTNKTIAIETDMPLTKVEHWFRTDSSFAIPSDDVWYKLKEVLGITTDAFDKQIMEFEIKDGVYETKQRVYSDEGKSPTLTHGNADKLIQIGTAVDINGHDILKRVYSPEGKAPTLNTMGGGNREPKVACGRMVGRYKVDGVRQDHKGSVAGKTTQMLELRRDQKTNNLSTVQKDNVLTKNDVYWRKLTPLECERLQTVPDNYTDGVSNTQRYKMLGNGWTVDVIAHILKNM